MGKFKYEKYDYTKIGIGVFKSLKTTWNVNLVYNFNSYTNIGAERELTAILSQQMAAEIDRQILEYLRNTNETSS